MKFKSYGKFIAHCRSPPVGEVWVEIQRAFNFSLILASPPVGEVWVEITIIKKDKEDRVASPPVGEVWVEIHSPAAGQPSEWVASRGGGVG